ncbi:hypothetical protein EMIT0111MI5_30250 [Burkholderia sp. IT-111MI5]
MQGQQQHNEQDGRLCSFLTFARTEFWSCLKRKGSMLRGETARILDSASFSRGLLRNFEESDRPIDLPPNEILFLYVRLPRLTLRIKFGCV